LIPSLFETGLFGALCLDAVFGGSVIVVESDDVPFLPVRPIQPHPILQFICRKLKFVKFGLVFGEHSGVGPIVPLSLPVNNLNP
jgi:hypothetical protein